MSLPPSASGKYIHKSFKIQVSICDPKKVSKILPPYSKLGKCEVK